MKDVIKPHQSETRSLGRNAYARAVSDTRGARAGAGPSVILTNTRALTSCFLPPGERSDKQERRWRRCWGCPAELWGPLVPDAASSATNWKGGTIKCSRGRPVLFLCGHHAERVHLEGGPFDTGTAAHVAYLLALPLKCSRRILKKGRGFLLLDVFKTNDAGMNLCILSVAAGLRETITTTVFLPRQHICSGTRIIRRC